MQPPYRFWRYSLENDLRVLRISEEKKNSSKAKETGRIVRTIIVLLKITVSISVKVFFDKSYDTDILKATLVFSGNKN